MYDRELGCKTIGCFIAAILVMGFFAYLLNVAQGIAVKHHEQQTAAGPSEPLGPEPAGPKPLFMNSDDRAAAANISRLPLLLAAARDYAKDNGGLLPPMGTPKAFHDAVAAKYMSTASADTFLSPRTGSPYVPNPALSGKPIASFAKSGGVLVFYEVLPPAGIDSAKDRTVIYLDGTLKPISVMEWRKMEKSLTASPASR